ncbi:MAG: type VI secretion system baseplate subunit TssF [Planctomycetes bacterium]|nr:type VI secretion system baseplate subunit TssF [Planctomycetota bacterium]
MSNVYYQDELRYLREVGPEFSKVNPEIARFLADRGSDPDVERVLEGVAFLCGRIRQKLDDELPEITASLMGLLWPHYLRPLPSMSVLELSPDIEAMQAPLPVPAGAEFGSILVDGTRCRFRSAWPVKLRPWLLEEARLETAPAKPVQLTIRFRSATKATLDKIELDVVRLFLSGDPLTAFTLYLLLSAHVDHVRVSNGAAAGNRRETLIPADCVSAAGLDRSEAVLPYPARSFPGYRLLQEYFAFKERFLFVDLRGLDRAVTELGAGSTLELAVVFNRRLETYPLVSAQNVRLHCVPILNLFEHYADPVRLQHEQTEYLLQPSKTGATDRRHYEVYSVDRVASLAQAGGGESRVFEPFFAFRHLATADPRAATYYQARVTPNIVGGDPRMGTDTYLSFVGGALAGGMPADATISVDLTCTNRHLPAALRAGDISEPTDTSPAGTKFRNLLKPTSTIAPPLGKALHWRLISHLSLNYVSLADTDHFKELLRVYDFQSEHDAQRALAHQRLLDGIISIRSRFQERMIRGAPVCGVRIDVELNEEHFAGEGDAYLFAGILDRFMGLYMTVNAYSELSVLFRRSGQVHTFPARWGEQPSPAGVRLGA